MYADGFRRYAIADDSDYWPDPATPDGGPNLRHAFYIWFGFAVIPMLLSWIFNTSESPGY